MFSKAAYKAAHKAAQQGYAQAQYNLAVMYGKGEGVVQNFPLSYALLLLASEAGEDFADIAKNAKEAIKTTVKPKLSPQQIAEGERLAQEWRERIAITLANK